MELAMTRRGGLRRPLRHLSIVASCLLMIGALAVAAFAAPGGSFVSGVSTPFNGAWLDSADGGHYWDPSGNGLCRIDTTANGSVENQSTCDLQATAPTQVAVGPMRTDGTYFIYVADMSSTSSGPVRLTFDPTADSGKGRIVAGSRLVVGGQHTAGFFSDASGSFRSSSVAVGPCAASITTPCTALYVAFERSKRVERIDFVDQPSQSQSIETISKTTDIRRGVRYGLADFHNANGTDDLYLTEVAGNGVSVIKNVASCLPSEGSADPNQTDPPVNEQGGCAATTVSGITTKSAQGIAVQDNADGTGRYLYVGDSPANAAPTVLRYHPDTGYQDIVSGAVDNYQSLANPGQTMSAYTAIGGLAVNPNTGDLYVGDDPTLLADGANEPAVGHIFVVAGDSSQTAPADCTGSATTQCAPPAQPGTVTGSLYAYGVTAPSGMAFLPSDNGGHLWLADEAFGFCRFDDVAQAPQLRTSNQEHCDDGNVLGSGGQAVYDDSVVPGTTNQHYVYVAQNDQLSPGVIRFTYNPSADNGNGDLVAGSAVIMAPNTGLNGIRAEGLALGPCKQGAPSTCRHSLYVAGLTDGFVRRINNPEDAPRDQTVDVVAGTQSAQTGQTGRGINGSMGLIGDDLYLPEDKGFTVVKDITDCPRSGAVCPSLALNIVSSTGEAFGGAVAVDPNPLHSAAGLVYASDAEALTTGTIYQYDVATNTSRVYLTRGQMPAAGTAAATAYCSSTCTRPADPLDPPGAQVPFKSAIGMYVNPDSNGTLYVTEDPLAGKRGERGHLWTAPYVPYPQGVSSVPLPGQGGEPGLHDCAVTVNVPALTAGESYWVQFTTHGLGTITSSWQLPVIQSAQLLVYLGNPFTGQTDPVVAGAQANPLARQQTTTSATFDVTTSPINEAPGAYTVQFLNGSSSFGATTATLTYTNDAVTACPTSPLTGNVVP